MNRSSRVFPAAARLADQADARSRSTRKVCLFQQPGHRRPAAQQGVEAVAFAERMPQRSQFGVQPMRGRFAGCRRFRGPQRTQQAQEPVCPTLIILESEDVQDLGQTASVAAGQLDRDRGIEVVVQVRRWAEAGDQGVDSARLEFAAVIASPTDDLLGRPTGQLLAPGIEPGDDAVRIEHEDRCPGSGQPLFDPSPASRHEWS